MALEKQMVSEKGIQTNYHNIECINKKKNSVDIFVRSYVGKEIREYSVDMCIMCRPYTFDCTPEDEISYEKAYEKLKTLEEFEGATDC